MGYNLRENVAHLRAAQASIHVLTALCKAVAIAGTVRVPSNIHVKEPLQQRRNEVSEKATAAFSEVYELLQAKAFDEEKLMKAQGYLVLARMAEVNEIILRDARDEERFEKLEEVDAENDKFEELTKRPEETTKEPSAKK